MKYSTPESWGGDAARGNAEQTKNGQMVGVSHRCNATPHRGGQAHAVPVRNQERNAQPPHPQIGGKCAGLYPGRCMADSRNVVEIRPDGAGRTGIDVGADSART